MAAQTSVVKAASQETQPVSIEQRGESREVYNVYFPSQNMNNRKIYVYTARPPIFGYSIAESEIEYWLQYCVRLRGLRPYSARVKPCLFNTTFRCLSSELCLERERCL